MNAEEILPAGYWVGEYEIEQVIGRGSMGIAYRAKQAALGRAVCIKFLRPDRTNHPTFVKKFEAEARALAGLSHPNILVVFQLGFHEDISYMVTEFVDGCTLFDLIQQGSLRVADFIRIIGCVGDALQYIHEQGVLHRDIKPGNILISKRGHVKLADFGIAKILTGGGVTSTGSVGTENYQAPEVDAGRPYDHRADIYSLAVTFYRMMTGQFPGMGQRIEQYNPEVPPAVDEVLGRALAFNPSMRYESVQAFCEELIGVLKGERIVIKEPSSDPKSGELPTRLAGFELPVEHHDEESSEITPPPSAPKPGKTPAPPKQIPPPVAGAELPPPVVPSRLAKRDEAAAPRSNRVPLLIGAAALIVGAAIGAAVVATRDTQGGTPSTAGTPPAQPTSTAQPAASDFPEPTAIPAAVAAAPAAATSSFKPFEGAIDAALVDETYVDREVAIVGEIKSIKPSNGPRIPTRLTLTSPPEKEFTIVYWDDLAEALEHGEGPPGPGTVISVRGKVEVHRDSLQIKLKKKANILIADGPVEASAPAATPALAAAEPTPQSALRPPDEQMTGLTMRTSAAAAAVSTALPPLEPWRVAGKLKLPPDTYTFLDVLPEGDLLATTTNSTAEGNVERAVLRISIGSDPTSSASSMIVRRDHFDSQRGYSGIAVSTDGSCFVSADTGDSQTCFVARLPLDNTVATTFGDQGVLKPGRRCLGVATDGLRLFVLVDWGKVIAFDPATGHPLSEEYTAGTQYVLRDLAYEPTGKRLFGYGKGQLVTWNIGESGSVAAASIQTLFAEQTARSTEGIGIDPTGPAAIAFPYGKRELWASNGATEPQRMTLGEGGDSHFVDIAVAPGGKVAYVSNLRQKEITVLRRGAVTAPDTETVVAQVATATPAADVSWGALSDEAFSAAIASGRKGVLVLVSSGEPARDEGFEESIGAAKLSATGGVEFAALQGSAGEAKSLVEKYKPAKFPLLLVLDGTGKEVARFHEGDTSHEAMFTLKILKAKK